MGGLTIQRRTDSWYQVRWGKSSLPIAKEVPLIWVGIKFVASSCTAHNIWQRLSRMRLRMVRGQSPRVGLLMSQSSLKAVLASGIMDWSRKNLKLRYRTDQFWYCSAESSIGRSWWCPVYLSFPPPLWLSWVWINEERPVISF